MKVIFEIEDGSGSQTESLWAKPEGDDRYRLANSPFYATGVSFEDVVYAGKKDGQLVFKKMASPSGHSTYRISLADTNESAIEVALGKLNGLGCSYEEGPYLALDVPPDVDIFQVYSLLEYGEATGLWEFEEGHCGHPAVAGGNQRAPVEPSRPT